MCIINLPVFTLSAVVAGGCCSSYYQYFCWCWDRFKEKLFKLLLFSKRTTVSVKVRTNHKINIVARHFFAIDFVTSNKLPAGELLKQKTPHRTAFFHLFIKYFMILIMVKKKLICITFLPWRANFYVMEIWQSKKWLELNGISDIERFSPRQKIRFLTNEHQNGNQIE